VAAASRWAASICCTAGQSLRRRRAASAGHTTPPLARSSPRANERRFGGAPAPGDLDLALLGADVSPLPHGDHTTVQADALKPIAARSVFSEVHLAADALALAAELAGGWFENPIAAIPLRGVEAIGPCKVRGLAWAYGKAARWSGGGCNSETDPLFRQPGLNLDEG
jgi:hypothetical protein